jgi:unsaturated rhamnogalacturonyl hydrolase
MKKLKLIFFVIGFVWSNTIFCQDEISKQEVISTLTKVADWQIENQVNVKHHPLDWTNGALYTGMYAWAKTSSSNKYMDWLTKIGQSHKWQPHKDMYHADDVVVLQTFLDMYKDKIQDPKSYLMLAPSLARIDYVVAHPSNATLLLDYKDGRTLERWTWCDALYMAPPVYAKLANITNDAKYLKFMDKEFKITTDFLYDKEEKLFYRDHRYFADKMREANGKKIFWGRGNGWVLGGLAILLKELPAKSKYRPYYEKLFKEMSEKVASLQGEDGYWHASLLDPASYPNPETSASSFFCFGLTYGVNSGLLPKEKYKPVAEKAWKAIMKSVGTDGKVGWIQPIGADPKQVTSDMTEVYGVGAFLLAGTEMMKMIK